MVALIDFEARRPLCAREAVEGTEGPWASALRSTISRCITPALLPAPSYGDLELPGAQRLVRPLPVAAAVSPAWRTPTSIMWSAALKDVLGF